MALITQKIRGAIPGLRLGLRRGVSTALGAVGDSYIVPAGTREAFERDGFVILRNFLKEEEVADIEAVYNRFMTRDIPVPGADFCDMSQPLDTKFEDFQIVNAMLPRKYHPALQGNVYERRAASVMKQLFPADVKMGIDYDQFLDKRPEAPKAIFSWHQDMAYWPPASYTPDTRTATLSLAIDATNEVNGALKFLPGSHVEKRVWPHVPLGKSREDSHAIAIDFDEAAHPGVVMAKLGRGDVSIHNEYIVHGSGGNLSKGHRRTYVLAFRTEETIALERRAGFTHSHNDKTNWDTFREWQSGEADAKEKQLA